MCKCAVICFLHRKLPIGSMQAVASAGYALERHHAQAVVQDWGGDTKSVTEKKKKKTKNPIRSSHGNMHFNRMKGDAQIEG